MTPGSREFEEGWLREAFRPWEYTGPYVPALGKGFFRPAGKHLLFRVEILPWHCNGSQTVHGGFVATTADSWLALNVAHALPTEARFTTPERGAESVCLAAAILVSAPDEF